MKLSENMLALVFIRMTSYRSLISSLLTNRNLLSSMKMLWDVIITIRLLIFNWLSNYCILS